MTAWRVQAAWAALWWMPLGASAAEPKSPPTSDVSADEASYPSLDVIGFTDAGFSASDAESSTSNSGFFQGQLVLHLTSALSSRLAFFGEVSVTTSGGGGAGYGGDYGHASGPNADLHRSLLKYTHSDALKLSIGRFHTPIGYWNVAFHHGQWLQTTAARPRMLDFSNPFLPLHFTGAFVEGRIPSGRANVSYLAGFGNGRGSSAGTPEAPGDANNHRAWMVRLSARPDVAGGLEIGGAWYEDKAAVQYGQSRADFREGIGSAYLALTKEKPELIVEYVAVRHRRLGRDTRFASWAAYAQAAWRVSARIKPYVRWEEVAVDEGDHVLDGARRGRGGLAGVRVDAADFVAVKAEYHRQEEGEAPFQHAVVAQVSLTF